MNISALLSQDESSQLEFKELLPTNEKLAALFCAFANTSGGDLIVGVEDGTKRVLGIRESSILDIEEKISSIAATSVSPMVFPIIKSVRLNGLALLVVHIDRGFQKPFRVTTGLNTGKIFVRVGSSTRQADRAAEEAMGLRSHGLSWDAMPNLSCPIEMLDIELIKEFIELRYERRQIPRPKKPDSTWLLKMRLAASQNDLVWATNGASLLFSSSPQDFFPSATSIEFARFAGTNSRDFIDKQSSSGPLWKLFDDALLFLRRHVDTAAQRSAAARREIIAYPEIAFREFMINALCHRAFEASAGPVRCAIFDDVIQITNPGAFPDGFELCDIGTGISMIRNPVIARVFNELGLIEGWGTGIQVAQQELAKRNLPPARIEQKGFFIQITSQWRWPNTLSDRETAILRLISSEGSVTSETVAKMNNTTGRAARKFLSQLVDSNLVIKHGSTKGSVYKLA